MLRSVIVGILITLLLCDAVPASAADVTVAQQVVKLKAGRKIRVELNSGENLKGRIGSVTAEQFALETDGPTRVVQFNEVRSVKPDGLTKGEKWAIFGIIWVAIGVVGKLTT